MCVANFKVHPATVFFGWTKKFLFVQICEQSRHGGGGMPICQKNDKFYNFLSFDTLIDPFECMAVETLYCLSLAETQSHTTLIPNMSGCNFWHHFF